MWVVFALASALFAGAVSILAKIGIRNTNSNLATALRTTVVAIMAWLMVFVTGSQGDISAIRLKSIVFLALSGAATGGSWLCYFRALQIGDVNKVVSIDKSSVVLTMLLSVFFLCEELNWVKAIAMILIGVGTYFMIGRKANGADGDKGHKWLMWAALSAVFASLTAILGKVGIADVESNLGTAIRTVVVLIMAWAIVFFQDMHRSINSIDKRSWIFIVLSGLATGLSWMCFYRALQDGPVSVVVPIDKLSIVVTATFSYFVFGEKLNLKSCTGLVMIIVGTLCLVFL